MMQFRLEISRVSGAIAMEQAGVGVVRGGPRELLDWLETQLALGPPDESEPHQTAAYARWIDAAGVAEIAESVAADRWETAAELLRRRDALRIGGWDGGSIDVDSPVVQALVAIEAAGREMDGGEAARICRVPERLDEIGLALDAGQMLPAHRVVLLEPLEAWPWRWQRVIERLAYVVAEPVSAHASPATSLGRIQRALAAGEVADVPPDASIAWVEVSGTMSAVELVASVLRTGTGLAEGRVGCRGTVVACADPAMRLRLEHRCAALGLPTAGVAVANHSAPAFQVLPLAIEMCVRPIAARRLLDFLQLPISPLPRRAARRLAQALAEQPGLGSERWEQVWREVCSEAFDPEGEGRALLEQWLPTSTDESRGDDSTSAEGLPLAPILERCAMVAEWANEKASRIAAERPHRVHPLSLALSAAAGHAEMVAELLQQEQRCSGGSTIERYPLTQLIRAARQSVPQHQPFECEEGSVRVVASPAELREPYDRLIWIGGWEVPRPPAEWSAYEVDRLEAAGIAVDTGEHLRSASAERQRDGVAFAGQSCLLVRTPSPTSMPIGSVWLHLEACLAGGDGKRRATGVRELIEGTQSHAALPIVHCLCGSEPPQPVRTSWRIAPATLPILSRSSSEMTDHLACPLRWVLRRVARIAPAGNVRLPGGYQLAGSFCHHVLRHAFEQERSLPRSAAEARRRVLEVFDERVEFDAAPLAGPAAAMQRGRLREQIGAATERLFEVLQAGEYTQLEFEVPFETPQEPSSLEEPSDPLPMRGMIDCLASRADGREVLIDFKFGGDARYREAIEQGRAVQLATYAWSRFRETGRYPAVAYLVLSTAQVHAPRESRPIGMRAEACASGPSIESVWRNFYGAIETASTWVGTSELLPCRPLQPPSQWPAGVELVLEPPPRSGEFVQSCCRYCDYGVLCGHTSLE